MEAVIIDDDSLSGELIARYLEKTGLADLRGNFTDPAKALNFLHEHKADLVFLDIEMPGMNGMEFIDALPASDTQIILVTSHKEFALEAFEHKVLDYLVKPFTYTRFLNAVSRARALNREEEKDENVFVKKDSQMVRIRKSDILWAEAMGDYSVLYTDKDKFVLHCTLKTIEEKLPSKTYLRVHRSYIIRIDTIEKVEDNTIFSSRKSMPIGKSYREEVFKRLKMF
jgi:DNA-binding LytR/AlgR family response regulator